MARPAASGPAGSRPRKRRLSLGEALRQGAAAARSHPLRALIAGVAIAAAVASIATVKVVLDGVAR